MDQTRWGIFLRIVSLVLNAAIAAVVSFTTHLYDKIPYHMSALSGASWVVEFLQGHPEHIRCELGVHEHVFQFLISYLQTIGVQHSRGVFLEEQLAIFLYRCVTGLSVRHVAEHFQSRHRYSIHAAMVAIFTSFFIFQVLFKDAFHILFQSLLYRFRLPAQNQ